MMPSISDPGQFTRALALYFGDDSDPGYDPVKALDGSARITAAFPMQGNELMAQVDGMFDAALRLPGLENLALADAMTAIRAFIGAEYSFLPSVLQATRWRPQRLAALCRAGAALVLVATEENP